MSSTTTKSSANATASSTKKKNTKPPKSYTKNKKHQKHRGAGDKHFAMSGSSSSGGVGGGVGGGGSRGFRFTPSFILKQNRDANAVDAVDTVDVNNVEKSAFGHRPIQSNEYRYQDADESDNDEEENNELLMTKFGVKDERARYLQVLLDDLSGASSYHRKPWEKEWELDTDAANVNADTDDLFNLNTNQLANELKLLPVQQRLNLFAEQDDCVLSSIMKVHSSSIVGGGETDKKKHDQSSDNGRFVTVSSVSLAHLCNEHQQPASVPISSIDLNSKYQQQQVEQQQLSEKEQELEEQDEDDDEYDLDDISEEELAESDDENESNDKQVEAATSTTVTKEAHQPPTVVQSQQKETPVSAQRTTAPNTISTGVTKQQDRVTVHRNDDADDDFFNQIDSSVNLTTVPPHHRSDIRNNNKQEQDDLDFIDNLLGDSKGTSVAAVQNQGSRTAQVNTTKSPPTISAVPTKTSTATNVTPKKSDDNLDDWLDSLI